MKEIARKQHYRKVRLISRSELNSQNRIMATNSLAIPVVQYNVNILNWTQNDIKLKRESFFLSITSIIQRWTDRLYIPRKEEGRGLIQLKLSYKTTTIGLLRYMETTKDWMIQLVKQHENRKKKIFNHERRL